MFGHHHIGPPFSQDRLEILHLLRYGIEQPPLYGGGELQAIAPIQIPGLARREHEVVHGVFFGFAGLE